MDKVVIRTNGGTLTINAPSDEVTHYGQADYVDIIAVKPASYEENGTVSLVKVAKGNIALTSDANVGQIHLAKTGNEFTEIKITLEQGAKLPDLSRDSVGTAIGDTPVLVCEVASAGTSEFYWLSGNGTIEDEKVLVSATANGTKTAATAENSTAVAIANAKAGEEVTDTGISVSTAEEIAEVTAQGAAKTFAEISSKEELIAFRDAWNAGKIAGGTFKLMADINLAGENWTPIGNWKSSFNGTFDGNNKKIIGLTAVGTLGTDGVYNIGGTIGFGECYGFFGIVGEGNTTINNLSFENVNINLVNGANVGAVIGYAPAQNKGYNGDIIETVGTVTLSNVTVSGTINASKHVGGLVGDSRTTGDVTFTNCVNNINITSTLGGQTGGIIGYANNCDTLTLTNSKNNGNITVTGTGAQGVAGLVGRVAGASVDVVISNCESNGSISSTGNISGIIDVEGQALNSLSITNSKVTGLVVTTGAYDAYVLHGLPSGSPTITHSGNTFTGIVEANKGADTTAKNAKLNDVVTPDGYAMAGIYKVQNWGDPTDYNDAGGYTRYYNSVDGIHPVGYVSYDTNGEWTQIEGKSIEYMAVGEGYYVFRVNGSDIYARYTENPETDYRTLSQHPDHGKFFSN